MFEDYHIQSNLTTNEINILSKSYFFITFKKVLDNSKLEKSNDINPRFLN